MICNIFSALPWMNLLKFCAIFSASFVCTACDDAHVHIDPVGCGQPQQKSDARLVVTKQCVVGNYELNSAIAKLALCLRKFFREALHLGLGLHFDNGSGAVFEFDEEVRRVVTNVHAQPKRLMTVTTTHCKRSRATCKTHRAMGAA